MTNIFSPDDSLYYIIDLDSMKRIRVSLICSRNVIIMTLQQYSVWRCFRLMALGFDVLNFVCMSKSLLRG